MQSLEQTSPKSLQSNVTLPLSMPSHKYYYSSQTSVYFPSIITNCVINVDPGIIDLPLNEYTLETEWNVCYVQLYPPYQNNELVSYFTHKPKKEFQCLLALVLFSLSSATSKNLTRTVCAMRCSIHQYDTVDGLFGIVTLKWNGTLVRK